VGPCACRLVGPFSSTLGHDHHNVAPFAAPFHVPVCLGYLIEGVGGPKEEPAQLPCFILGQRQCCGAQLVTSLLVRIAAEIATVTIA